MCGQSPQFASLPASFVRATSQSFCFVKYPRCTPFRFNRLGDPGLEDVMLPSFASGVFGIMIDMSRASVGGCSPFAFSSFSIRMGDGRCRDFSEML
jgi:hypothetical protein